MQRRELGLDKGKGQCDAFWSCLERWVWFGCWRCSIAFTDGVVHGWSHSGSSRYAGMMPCRRAGGERGARVGWLGTPMHAHPVLGAMQAA
jgi:hypothetical protein